MVVVHPGHGVHDELVSRSSDNMLVKLDVFHYLAQTSHDVNEFQRRVSHEHPDVHAARSLLNL